MLGEYRCLGEAELIAGRLTSGPTLARGVVWNALGQGLPLVAALFAVPILIDVLGTDRFGVLTLAWIAIGYFGLFDLGLGRALTQLVAGSLGNTDGDGFS